MSGFWQVELTGDFVIDNVVVWNRTDCCGARLRSIRLSVFDDLTEVFGVDLFTALGTFAPTTFSVDAGDVQGDRVRIAYIDTENLPDDAFLTLAEVQVFETERRQTPQAPEPAALALFALGLAGLGLSRVRTAA